MLSKASRTCLVLIPAMTVPFISSLLYFVFFSDYYFARALYGATKVFIIVWPLVSLYFILHLRFFRSRIDIRKHLRALPPGILIGLAIVVLMFILKHTIMSDIVNSSSDKVKAKAQELGFASHFILFALFVSFLHSFIEEYFWRWFVFGQLKRVISTPLAHISAGLCFSAHHVVMTSQFFPLVWAFILGGIVGIGGIIWSVMYDRQKTLAGPWISHLIVDIGLMAIGYEMIFRRLFW